MKTQQDPFNLGDEKQTSILRQRLKMARALHGVEPPPQRHRMDFGPFTKIAIAVTTWTLAILWVIENRRR